MTPTLLEALARDRILPLFTPSEPRQAQNYLSVLSLAGLQAVELTHRSPQSLNVFTQMRGVFPDLLLGAGTILSAGQAEAFLTAGAAFIVSPCWIEDVAAVCRAAGVPYLPGAATVREVFEAQQRGAEVVKVFPGEVLGPAFVRALLGPLPDSQLLVTGGVEATQDSLREWLGAGALAVGLGSRLFQDAAGLEARLTDLLGLTRPLGGPP